MERKLAVIFSTDVQGYSRLMGEMVIPSPCSTLLLSIVFILRKVKKAAMPPTRSRAGIGYRHPNPCIQVAGITIE